LCPFERIGLVPAGALEEAPDRGTCELTASNLRGWVSRRSELATLPGEELRQWPNDHQTLTNPREYPQSSRGGLLEQTIRETIHTNDN
jgi:hypothetical protein